ncbi:MAG: hypothetical protein WBB94_03495 [Candidatus Saccharimonadaceae bacterium]
MKKTSKKPAKIEEEFRPEAMLWSTVSFGVSIMVVIVFIVNT